MTNSVKNIIVFTCNWDGLSCVETASQKGLHYPSTVKIVRMSCLSRVHSGLMLKAFELGADGVMLLGCKEGDCHYEKDAGLIEQEYRKTRSILELLGFRQEQLSLVRMSRGDGAGFVKEISNFMSSIEKAQPSLSR
jgi:coenzyme F420-reducing hydrogenase delta subunit